MYALINDLINKIKEEIHILSQKDNVIINFNLGQLLDIVSNKNILNNIYNNSAIYKEDKAKLLAHEVNNKKHSVNYLNTIDDDISHINNLKNDIRNTSQKINNYNKMNRLIKDIEDSSSVSDIFSKHIKTIYSNTAQQVIYKLDKSVINFVEDLKSKSKDKAVLKLLKTSIPDDLIDDVVNNFKCIIAGLRDYSNIIPLKKEIFDLVIIDESSQVSIAQAFPAIFRAKKVLILGDKEQFANTKSGQASSSTNNLWQTEIKEKIKQENLIKTAQTNLEIFNVKNSVMDFFETINPDYTIMLNTHFRGYPEMISFSNIQFYKNKLKTLKCRHYKPSYTTSKINKFSHIKTQ